MLEQAIRRISILEDRSGVKICRVMEPPHGVVDPSMFGPLAMLGYEAVLVTIERFLQANRSAKMSSSFGIRMVEHVADGLALIPRLKVAPNWRSNVLLAEVLQQPIVIVGHHYDAAHGMDLIAEMAGFINNLGTVRWHNLTSIARAHYSYSIEGAIMSVSMSSRRVMIEVPHQVRSLVIHRPWIEGGDVQRLEVWTDGGPKEVLQNLNCRAQSDPFEVTPGSKIQISSPYPNVLDPGKFPRRPVHYSPYLRRMLTEIRDRISPLTGGHRAPGSGA